MSDPVKHPKHYTAHPSGVECNTIASAFNFNLGNVIKYVWRAGLKGNVIEDLEKARQYLDFEIERLSKPAAAEYVDEKVSEKDPLVDWVDDRPPTEEEVPDKVRAWNVDNNGDEYRCRGSVIRGYWKAKRFSGELIDCASIAWTLNPGPPEYVRPNP